MLFKKTRSHREKIKNTVKNYLTVLSLVILLAAVSYLFLSGFNYIETFLGWKKNIIAGLITGLMAAWLLLEVIIRYLSRHGRDKLYDKLSLWLYVFLFISLLTAFFINFGALVGVTVILLTAGEACWVWWRQASPSKRKKFKRSLPWIFYR